MFFLFGKFPFLLRLKNALSGSHSVLSGTSPLLVRRYPLIDRLLSGTHPVNVRFPVACPVLVRSFLNFQAPHTDSESFELQRR